MSTAPESCGSPIYQVLLGYSGLAAQTQCKQHPQQAKHVVCMHTGWGQTSTVTTPSTCWWLWVALRGKLPTPHVQSGLYASSTAPLVRLLSVRSGMDPERGVRGCGAATRWLALSEVQVTAWSLDSQCRCEDEQVAWYPSALQSSTC